MTQTMTAATAKRASHKTQHVRSAGDWVTLVLLVVAALIVLFPLLVLTVNAFKTQVDYNAAGPLSLPKTFTMEGIVSFWTTTKFSMKFLNSLIISLTVAVAAVVLSVLNSFALGIGRVKGNTWIVLAIMLANMMPQEALLYPLYTMFKAAGLYNTKLAIIIIFTIIQSAYGTTCSPPCMARSRRPSLRSHPSTATPAGRCCSRWCCRSPGTLSVCCSCSSSSGRGTNT